MLPRQSRNEINKEKNPTGNTHDDVISFVIRHGEIR
jgi:hypothetical protein